MDKRLMGVEEVCEFLGIKRQTIYNQISAGKFPIAYKKVFRRLKFEREDVLNFLNQLPRHEKWRDN